MNPPAQSNSLPEVTSLTSLPTPGETSLKENKMEQREPRPPSPGGWSEFSGPTLAQSEHWNNLADCRTYVDAWEKATISGETVVNLDDLGGKAIDLSLDPELFGFPPSDGDVSLGVSLDNVWESVRKGKERSMAAQPSKIKSLECHSVVPTPPSLQTRTPDVDKSHKRTTKIQKGKS
jgi:hypothetical protein